jgi:hypothetical protein
MAAGDPNTTAAVKTWLGTTRQTLVVPILKEAVRIFAIDKGPRYTGSTHFLHRLCHALRHYRL